MEYLVERLHRPLSPTEIRISLRAFDEVMDANTGAGFRPSRGAMFYEAMRFFLMWMPDADYILDGYGG